MKKFKYVLWSLLRLISSALADSVDNFLLQSGILKQAINKNPNTVKMHGKIARWVYADRLDTDVTKGTPSHFNIKDPGTWTNRWSKFRQYFHLSQLMKFDLKELYEGSPTKKTWFNYLEKQLSQFWTGITGGPWTFLPGTTLVSIGNGTLPDIRDMIITSSPGKHITIAWDSSLVYGNEYADDILQVMCIAGDGSTGVFLPSIGAGVTRAAGTATFVIPVSGYSAATFQSFIAAKFKSGAELMGKPKGIFRFPVGITPTIVVM